MKDIIGALVSLVVLLVSCSKANYVQSIPKSSMAVMAIDVPKLGKDLKAENILKTFIGADSNVADCGIDLSSKLYLFEAADMNFGLCAKVDDVSKLAATFDALVQKGTAVAGKERKGCQFYTVNNVWAVGFNDDALLLMGPQPLAVQPDLQLRMAKLLNIDLKKEDRRSPLLASVDAIDAPMALVARLDALPENVALPFTLGLPKRVNLSQVVLKAGLHFSGNALLMKGETFSYNQTIDESLKRVANAYRPIGESFLKDATSPAALTLFANMEGDKLLGIVQDNVVLSTLLTGLNTAIDMDNIIRSVDGNIIISTSTYASGQANLSMKAQVKATNWLMDVGYWKRSCPPGSTIYDAGPRAYVFDNGSYKYYFGLKADNSFYCLPHPPFQQPVSATANGQVSPNIANEIRGKRLALVFNLDALAGIRGIKANSLDIVKSYLGGVNTIVYILE
ncbi:MAG: DUF4836 family protein [Prevotella conceptionensis]